MKILIPVLGFGKAGGYRVLSRIADELINREHEVTFLSPDGSDHPYYPTKGKIYWIQNNHNISEIKKASNRNDSAITIQRKLIFGLRKKGKDFDLILANHSLTIFSIKLAGLLKKTVYYVQAYEPDYYLEQGGLKNKLVAYFSRKTYGMGLFTVVNADIYRSYKNLRSERVLYPGIEFFDFYPKEKFDDATKEDIIIGTIGGGAIYKGTAYVIDAFKVIQSKYKSAHLLVAFGSKDLEKVDGVQCIHPDGDGSLANYYRGLDYYICANYSQIGAFHYPIVEAMACATPVITTQYYPTTEFNSWQIKSKNVEDIVRQFENAYHNEAHCAIKIKRGLHDVMQFRWNLFGEKMESYLFEALAAKENKER